MQQLNFYVCLYLCISSSRTIEQNNHILLKLNWLKNFTHHYYLTTVFHAVVNVDKILFETKYLFLICFMNKIRILIL